MADNFDPVPEDAGFAMARWLCEGIEQRKMPEETYVLCLGDEILGFFAVRRARVKISFKSWPLFELRRRIANHEPLPGLVLVSFVRSNNATEAGFGQALFDYALGVALDDPAVVAIFVDPDNPDVSRMWVESYNFRPMHDPETPGLLYFSVDPAPVALWP